MTKSEACELFIAMCKDDRTRFDSLGVGMAGPDHMYRHATIRTDIGDDYRMTITNYPGGYAMDPGRFNLTEQEYAPLREAWDWGSGNRKQANEGFVRKMLGLS